MNNLEEKTIVLLASKGTGVGKSVLANTLQTNFKKESQILSFAGDIRKDISSILDNKNISGNYFTQAVYNDIKNKFTDLGIGHQVVLRSLIGDYSDLIQKHFGETVWAELLLNKLYYPLTIVDDWRREIESNYLVKYSNARVLKVYLEKEDMHDNQESTYENLIDPKTCNLHLIFDKDRSNFEEIKESVIKLIENK